MQSFILLCGLCFSSKKDSDMSNVQGAVFETSYLSFIKDNMDKNQMRIGDPVDMFRESTQ